MGDRGIIGTALDALTGGILAPSSDSKSDSKSDSGGTPGSDGKSGDGKK